MPHNSFNTLKSFQPAAGKTGQYYSLPALAQTFPNVKRLPVSIRIVLESVLRNVDGKKVTEEHVKELASWKATGARTEEIPFILARIVLQDFTGVPVLADLAAMRSVAARMGKDAKSVEPLVPVDLVVDHSVQIDNYGAPNVLDLNMKLEMQRNKERYQFMKWGMQAFDTFKIVPPGIGIVHQVNLEYLARGVFQKNGVYYPDTLVGTDSHTTMINGIGVVGKFVEFFGDGLASLSLPDRATIAYMAPEYGATMGFFAVDDKTIDYFRGTGRTAEEVSALEAYMRAQEMFGIPKKGEIDYSEVVEIDLDRVRTSLAGPKRPQDRIELGKMKSRFTELFSLPVASNGFAKKPEDLAKRVKTKDGVEIGNGDILIAAITSCTNTSNPSVLLAAGLLAKKAVEKGLKVSPHIKTSLAPGSRVVTEYLKAAGLLESLEKLNFYVSAYGCTTCIGNAGPLAEPIDQAIVDNDLVCAAVLSGNRNFEARIHPNLRANFLGSPPLVVAYAIAGTVLKDLETEPLGQGKDGKPVYLRDIWPTTAEVHALLKYALDPKTFGRLYGDFTKDNPMWQAVPTTTGQVYTWPKSTYIAEPPFFENFGMSAGKAHDVKGARILGIFGDSVTTDHISPAGSIKESSPAGQYLIANGVMKQDFNSYGARRGNHEVMMRGTFANVRIKNLMLPPRQDGSRVEGGVTLFQPSGEQMSIYDAAMKYISQGTPTVVFGGEEYGTGSSRDWAAKGTQLLGIKAVVVRSFERIHRSNLVGMGVLPLQFKGNDSCETLGLKGDETVDVLGIENGIQPQMDVKLVVRRPDGTTKELTVLLRIDTPIEVDYYMHGGILPFVLRDLVGKSKTTAATA
jgi:aconitate hydratase